MTGTYLGERCWNAEETELLRNTASSPADAADSRRGKHIFDALHTPPPLRRYPDVRKFTSGQDSGQPASQADMLAAIEEGRKIQRTMLFVAGATGAGKSHMVSWMHAQHRVASDDICIHIPREDTNLVRVVEILIEHLSEHADDLKRLLVEAGNVSVGERSAVELDLVTGLSDYARRVVEESRRFQSRALSDEQKDIQRQLGRDVADPIKPAHVDVVTSKPELTRAELWEELIRTGPAQRVLTFKGGPLDRMQSEDPDERRLDEAHLEPLARIGDGDLAAKLHTLRDELAVPETRVWILENLVTPRAMDHAVQRAGASIKADALQKALQAALKAAGDAGERVVFFFEDWGTVTGVRSGLLEVFTSMQPPHIAVIADTTDELRRLRDNVADRSVSVFEIGEAVESFALEVTARALNAVRNGSQRLHSSVGDPANQCTDCIFVRECHEAFGTVAVDGLGDVGMFPLTPQVVTRAGASGRIRTTPRSLLVDLVRPALEEDALLGSGQFPSAALVEKIADPQLRLDATQRALLAAEQGADAPWVERVLALYRSQKALNSVSSELAAAFGIAVDATGACCVRCGKDPCECGPTPCATCGMHPCQCQTTKPAEPPNREREIPRAAQDAQLLGEGTALVDRPRLRRILQNAAVATVPFGDGISKKDDFEKLKRLGNRLIGFAEDEGDTYAAEIRSADHEAIKALAWASETAGSYREQDLSHLRRAAATNLLERWRHDLEATLRYEGRAARAITALRSLAVLRSLTLEQIDLEHPYDLLDLALGTPGQAPSSRWVSADGARALQKALRLRPVVRSELLADVALVQGDGSPFGVDVDLLHDGLEAAFTDRCAVDASGTAAGLTPDAQSLATYVETAVAAEREGLVVVQAAIARLSKPFPISDLDDLRSATRQLEAAILDAVSMQPRSLREALTKLNDSVDAAAHLTGTAQAWVPVAPNDVATVDLHAIYLNAARAYDNLAPRAAITDAAVALLHEVGALRTGGDMAGSIAELQAELDRFNKATGNQWSADPSSGPSEAVLGPGQSRASVVDELLSAVDLATSGAAADRHLERISAGKLKAQLATRAVGQIQALAVKGAVLGLAIESIPPTPGPKKAKDALRFLEATSFADWTEDLRGLQARAQHAVTAAWQDRVEKLRVPDMRSIAESLGDNDAVEAFDDALIAADQAKLSAPQDLQAAVDELEAANAAAWNALERHRGAALDLARTIEAAGGAMPITSDVLSEVAAALNDGALAFEIRLSRK